MKRIVVVLGSSAGESLGRTLAQEYRAAATAAGAEVRLVDLAALAFDPNLVGGLSHSQPLEPDLARAQADLGWADHWVFVYPNWWGTYPARLKGFIDRVFLPGFAFQYQKGSPLPIQLMKGKSARLIVTMDGPRWWFGWVQGAGGTKALVRSVLGFCGVKTLGVFSADRLRPRASAPVDAHRRRVAALGRRDGLNR